MRVALLLLLVCLATLAPRPARASTCTPFEGGVSPATGTPLPARGVIFLFVPMWLAAEQGRAFDVASLEKTLSIAGATYQARTVQQDATAIVARLSYQATAPKIELTLRRERVLSASYPIAAELPRNHATVKLVEHRRSGGSEATSNAILIELDSTAIAYRVAWTDGLTTFAPRNFLAYASSEPRSEHQLRLGRPPCVGYNVAPERLARARSFRLFALYADGTEEVFPVTARAKLGTSTISGEDQVRLPSELVGTTAGPDRTPSLLLRLLADLRDNLPLVALCFAIFFALGFFVRHRRNQFRR